MAYTTGHTILDDEYNIFATGNAAGTGDNGTANLNTLWGTGTTDWVTVKQEFQQCQLDQQSQLHSGKH